MISKVHFNDLKNLKPAEGVDYLKQLKKYAVKEATLMDVLNEKALSQLLIETYFRDLSPRGVYLFFDCDDYVRYIGQTKQSFYQRILTQLDVTHYPGYGWNSMLSIMSGKRTALRHDELTEEDHEVDFKEVCDYKLVLIECGLREEFSDNALVRIEKTLLKSFREVEGERLLNSRIGWLRPEDWEKTIEEIIK